jgi:hypothetical protein
MEGMLRSPGFKNAVDNAGDTILLIDEIDEFA